MSTRELRRAELLGRVKSKTLRLTEAAKILELSYRRTKRLWKRYRGEGANGCSTAVRELRRKGIQDYEAANAYLEADGPASRRVLFHPCASLGLHLLGTPKKNPARFGRIARHFNERALRSQLKRWRISSCRDPRRAPLTLPLRDDSRECGDRGPDGRDARPIRAVLLHDASQLLYDVVLRVRDVQLLYDDAPPLSSTLFLS